MPGHILQVPDCEHPEFFTRMNRLVELNEKVIAIGQLNLPGPVKAIMRAPVVERMVMEITKIYFTAPMRSGSVDINKMQAAY